MKSIAIFSGAKLGEKAWKPDAKVSSVAIFGASSIDFRTAEIEENTTQVTAFSFLGATQIVVPAGMRVNLSGFSLFGLKRSKVKDTGKEAASAVKELDINAISILGAFQVTE